MPPIIRSHWPIRTSVLQLVVFVASLGLIVAALCCNMLPAALGPGALATLLLLAEIDRRVPGRCPHCQRRSVWVTGTGGIWYEDWREERVFWGECSSCGKRVVRRGGILAAWKAHPGS